MELLLDCPDDEKLAGYAQNDLPNEDASGLEAHLTSCRSCLTRYLELGRQSPALDIPDCHFVKEIGRGRFGVVYKAWWTKGEPRIVALKLLTCSSDMEKSRFDREIAVLRKLDSPSIVKYFDSGTSGDAVYYVMEFVEGVHLDEYLKRSASTVNEKLEIFERVCRAVAEAHEKGVVHRDLKPRNILIDAQGRPHILDFGICSVDTSDWSGSARATITHPGDVIGTLRYMSPEQAWGGTAGAIDERSDIWALGIMLYEIVTAGDYPYSLEPTPDKSIHEALLDRIRRELPRLPRLQSLPRGRDLETLLARCLAWEPDQRIESASALADDLRRYAGGQPVKTKPLWIPYRLKRLAVGAATRSRWMFSVLFVATMGLALWVAAWAFDVGWLVSGHQYDGRATGSTILGASADARDGIVVAGVFDDTVEAVVDFAAEKSIEGVTTGIRTWRGVHGHLMERLATARPRVVVWDYYFRTPQPNDAQLVAGLQKLEEAGTPVLLAALSYDDDGKPDLSPGITGPLGRDLRYGAIVVRDMVERPGEFVTAIKRAEHVIVPSLALTTLAATLHPQARVDLDWSKRNRWAEVLYQIQPEAYLRERDRIEFTKVFKTLRRQPTARVGDLQACNTFEMGGPEYWDRRTIPYQTLLTCSDTRLKELLENKLIVVGDLRTARLGFRPDRHRVKFGATTIDNVPGCYLLADSIAGLLDRRYVKAAFPLPTTTFVLMLLVATAGCLPPMRLATVKALERTTARRLLVAGVLILAVPCFLVMVVADSYVLVHAGMAGFTFLTTMVGSFAVEFARNRHRVAERSRRALSHLGLTTGGTVTLPLKRPRLLSETR